MGYLQPLFPLAARTPSGQWVRVVGGFSEFQFAERRLPTLDEINAAAPDTPVFILHLYDRALLNRAALRAVGYTRDTPDPPGGLIERDAAGEPTGLLKDSAQDLVRKIIPPPAEAELQAAYADTMAYLLSLGITSFMDAASDEDSLKAYARR